MQRTRKKKVEEKGINTFEELRAIARKDCRYSEWSKQRTLIERVEFLRKEVEELQEVVRKSNVENLREELGDVFWDALTIVAHAEEQGLFTTKEVLSQVVEKVQERKPWIFTGEKLSANEDRRWQESKQKKTRGSKQDAGAK